MAKLFLVAGLLMLVVPSRAQQWFEGVAVLEDRQVVAGTIARQSADLILIRKSDGVAVFPAHRLSSFRFYDPVQNINRMFVSGVEGEYRSARFFEVVVAGEITVMRDQSVFSEDIDECRAKDFRYFLRGPAGTILPIRTFRRDFLRTIAGALSEDELSRFSSNEPADVIRMIRLYNQRLFTPSIAGIGSPAAERSLRSK